ncbi:MAG: hypothetical protein ABSA76_13890 [Bacteroidales bacterium]
MKKIVLCLMATCLSLTLLPLQSNAATAAVPDSLVVSRQAESVEAKSLEIRVNETNAMDKSKLKLAEKKNLQQVEVVSTRHHYRQPGSVVYITGGGVLLIILLLIILL